MPRIPEGLDYSRLFDSIIVDAKISMSGRCIATLYGVEALKAIKEAERRYTRGFYRISAELTCEGVDSELRAYMYNGVFIAAILSKGGSRVYGDEALAVIDRLGSEGYNIKWLDVYEAPVNVLREIVGNERFSALARVAGEERLEEERAEEAREVPEGRRRVERVEAVTPEAEAGRVLATTLVSIGFTPINVNIERAGKGVRITADMEPKTPWMSTKNLLYVMASKYCEIARPPEYMSLEIRFGDLRDSLELASPAAITLASVVGKTIYEAVRRRIPVLDCTYELSEDGNSITIRFRVDKSVLSRPRLREHLMEVYNSVKRYWRGNMQIGVKAGRFGREIRVP